MFDWLRRLLRRTPARHEIEREVMCAIARIGPVDGTSGVPIMDEVSKNLGVPVPYATIHLTLGRLVHRGYVIAELRASFSGGRRKFFYMLTDDGWKTVGA